MKTIAPTLQARTRGLTASRLVGLAAVSSSILLWVLTGNVLGGPTPSQSGVAGTVTDASAMTPMAGVRVSLQASGITTETASDGTFFLDGAVGSGLVIVGAAKGYYNANTVVTGPTGGVQLALERVPPSDDPAYSFFSPGGCGTCHPDQYAQWSGSPMSRAGQNTWVYDIYDGTGSAGGMGGFVYKYDSVHAGANPNSECASCHQPEPWIEQPFKALDPIGSISQGSMHGVSCEVCHKLADMDESKTNFPGIYPGVVTMTRPDFVTDTQVEYGVLADTSYDNPYMMRPSYQPQLTATVCAACHQDKNDPDLNGNFEEPNGIISEPTYGEWLASSYADPAAPEYATCVECHMPSYGATTVCQTWGYVAPIRDPETIRSHTLEGTTPAFLEDAVELSLDVLEFGSSLQVDVSVKNDRTGHHVPTGVTVRNMILLVDAWRDVDGQPLAHTGTQTVHALGGVGDPTSGYYAGLPGKLYAKLIHDGTGASPTFFTDATGIQFDNRIPALAQDDTSYTFDVPPGSGQLHVRTRLIYRRAFRVLVDAKQWTTDGHGAPLEDVQAPYFGHLMEETSWIGGGGAVQPFGTACGGLVAGWQNVPAVGANDLLFSLNGALPVVPAFFVLGFSNTTWLGLPLPLDLGPFGAQGCELGVALDLILPTVTSGLGSVSMPVPIPGDPALAGKTFYVQWSAADASYAFGLAASRGLSVTIQP